MTAAERQSAITDLEHYAHEVIAKNGNAWNFSTPRLFATRLQRIAELLKVDAERQVATLCDACDENAQRATNYRAVIWTAARAVYPQPLRLHLLHTQTARDEAALLITKEEPATGDLLVTAFLEGESAHELVKPTSPSGLVIP